MEIYREDDIAGDQKSQKHPVYIYSDRDADGALASGRDDSCNHLLYDSSDKTIYFSSYDVSFELPCFCADGDFLVSVRGWQAGQSCLAFILETAVHRYQRAHFLSLN